MRTGSHRVTGTLLALGFLAGWVAAVWVSPPPVVTQTAPPRPTPATPAVAMPRVALDRVAAPDARPETRRNPFAFRDRDLAARPHVTAPDAAPPAPDLAVEPANDADRLPWRLVGLASSDDGVSTAIVSGQGDVHLLRIGERLPDGVEIVGIDGRQVTLRLASGDTRVLDLR